MAFFEAACAASSGPAIIIVLAGHVGGFAVPETRGRSLRCGRLERLLDAAAAAQKADTGGDDHGEGGVRTTDVLHCFLRVVMAAKLPLGLFVVSEKLVSELNLTVIYAILSIIS